MSELEIKPHACFLRKYLRLSVLEFTVICSVYIRANFTRMCLSLRPFHSKNWNLKSRTNISSHSVTDAILLLIEVRINTYCVLIITPTPCTIKQEMPIVY